MMQKCKSLLPVTKALRNNNIPHQWGYPIKLTITHDGNTAVITCLDEGLALLISLDILPDQTAGESSHAARLNTQEDWQMVSRKKKKNKKHYA